MLYQIPASSTDIDDDGAFTRQQFCQRYGIGTTPFYEDVKAKRLVAKKCGARTLVPRSKAREWLNALPTIEGNKSVAA